MIYPCQKNRWQKYFDVDKILAAPWFQRCQHYHDSSASITNTAKITNSVSSASVTNTAKITNAANTAKIPGGELSGGGLCNP
ncbi:hypothetical protein [Alkalinema sp. FACHB-956]|uniref:hypothetical protein n=1 Tax=Alkalinema sp. FACHB-956 TaxID=2692768 RepID=UPI001685A540|nr:hypothetical protein [Alkalinema sp. FACHB-956]MBD2327611.1 hypothetical protein [Alkalinema sp. FACHB-956]